MKRLILSLADCFISGSKTNCRGIALLIKNNFKYKIHDIQHDLDGNLLILDLNIASVSVGLINIYLTYAFRYVHLDTKRYT